MLCSTLVNSDPPESVAKQSVVEVYPQVLALPTPRCPVFPGFYKAVMVRNPAVVAAIREMMKCGQPYLGAFLLKEEGLAMLLWILTQFILLVSLSRLELVWLQMLNLSWGYCASMPVAGFKLSKSYSFGQITLSLYCGCCSTQASHVMNCDSLCRCNHLSLDNIIQAGAPIDHNEDSLPYINSHWWRLGPRTFDWIS
jgi:hypothetical protein